jgi:adenylosuccinate synthase
MQGRPTARSGRSLVWRSALGGGHMPTRIVVGGQYGSEGKGKVVALCAGQKAEPWVVRCGGPNSGHTTNVRGRELVLRQIPAAAGHPNALLMLSAGCAVDEELLLAEIRDLGLPRDRVVVDPRAVLVTDADKTAEEELSAGIGSTASGTGMALSRRMMRGKHVKVVQSSERIRQHARVEAVAPLLHEHLDRGGDVIVEGTQGFALSLLHGPDYPYATSRDTTAAAFAMEAGLSPRQIDEIVLVVRTFPIRVGGPSGPFANEVSWEEVRALSGAPQVREEFTSVTGRLRRVARFDLAAVSTACQYNRPTSLAVMGIDRLDFGNYGARRKSDLTDRAVQFVGALQQSTGIPIEWVGTGFETRNAIFMKSPEKQFDNDQGTTGKIARSKG